MATDTQTGLEPFEQLELIRRSVQEWNKYRKDNPNDRINLSGADLSGADLRGANLSGANLSGANLVTAILVRANLEDAALYGARLVMAHLEGADLRGANLSGANLFAANLREANLYEADLSGADLFGVLSGGNLSRADLSGADLRGELSGANLSGADLDGAQLYRADLSGAVFDESTVWPEPFRKPPAPVPDDARLLRLTVDLGVLPTVSDVAQLLGDIDTLTRVLYGQSAEVRYVNYSSPLVVEIIEAIGDPVVIAGGLAGLFALVREFTPRGRATTEGKRIEAYDMRAGADSKRIAAAADAVVKRAEADKISAEAEEIRARIDEAVTGLDGEDLDQVTGAGLRLVEGGAEAEDVTPPGGGDSA